MPAPDRLHGRTCPDGTPGASGASARLRIGSEARGLRRRVGPAAWMVLEELLLASTCGRDRRLGVEVSVRDLAELTGMGKDAVARALRRLLAAGVVVRSFGERGPGGAFGQVRYQVRLEQLAGVSLEAGARRVPSPVPAATSRSGQAALFERDGLGP